MAIRKLNPEGQLWFGLLERKSEAVRRSVSATIRAAEQHLLKSEAIVSQSQLVLERARKTLGRTAEARLQRHSYHQDPEDQSSAPRK